MNNQDKINFIRKKCIAANPEIAELKFGCEVEWQGKKFVFNGDIVSAATEYHLNGKKQIGVVGRNDFLPLNDCEILGRPIRLADVLLYKSTLAINGIGCFMLDTAGEMPKELPAAWNLRTDDLEQQSEETINVLYDLLK